ncbi:MULTISPECIES: glycerate kinase [Methylobacterium]|uniref:Hydroxypyruvate reductase n=2 Tax=Pseudomonadota TaxID=1224 RepID=A0ABQ4SV24_9HYPH|nr:MULTISPECIES: glycerate kinase [Methylobacterium]PIU05914.1 MAG: glycerate kinase [Methylobacterium sp. CG09_land_8_20_14_0_10_71_15]PIU12718.1 MAG: glycerate kinase [Methylobacterium sp. CG08_land_8_20_14_0_20_71_15]GBU18771.1 hydroxypyruvate reductase [Methylobacterium sp.]GJE05733.1 Putative hydroxypyruvate reductase [Methylobacterium jeotgali]
MTAPDTAAVNEQRILLGGILDEAIAAAHPSRCLAGQLPAPSRGRLVILGAGKAAGSMAAVASRFYREEHGLGADRVVGLAVARHGYGEEAPLIRMVEAGHPVPDAAGIEATREALRIASEAGPDDEVLVLLSGGGSANWIAPAGALTLPEKQAITKALLRSGAPIGEINTVRKHLSRIKGGRLAVAARNARSILTLAISDVPFDDPAVIASGPTVPDPSTLAQARDICERRSIPLPEAAKALLSDPANETPKAGDPAFARAEYRIVARPIDALEAAAAAARRAGYEPVMLGSDLEGEAREVAAEQARLALEIKAAGRRAALISGGELTVTIRGEGNGGPNQEYALALAIALDGAEGISGIAADTDGTDGGRGEATDPAGGLVDPTTLARARAAGLDPVAMLADNDSTRFFDGIGDLVRPGPTRTNVNDCRVILIG